MCTAVMLQCGCCRLHGHVRPFTWPDKAAALSSGGGAEACGGADVLGEGGSRRAARTGARRAGRSTTAAGIARARARTGRGSTGTEISSSAARITAQTEVAESG
eukprot:2477918-Rhodomonas_salina.1